MAPRPRGQSEVIGVILLTGVVTILVLGTGLLVLSDTIDTDEEALATVESDLTVDNLTLDVRGGDVVDASAVAVILRANSTERLRLDRNFTLRRGTDDRTFEPGDQWRGDNPLGSGEISVLVVDTDSGAVLHEATYVVGRNGIVLEIDGESESATIANGEKLSSVGSTIETTR